MVENTKKKFKLAAMRHGESELVKERSNTKKLIESDPELVEKESNKTRD